MKNIYVLIVFLCSYFSFGQVQNADLVSNPAEFGVNDEITITFSNVDPTLWNAGQSDNIYLWAWYYKLDGSFGDNSPTNGDWTNSNEAQKLTNNGNGTYSITITPRAFYGTSDISRLGLLAKAKDGSDSGAGDKKTEDEFLNVAVNEINLTSPLEDVTIVDSGVQITITATTKFTSDFSLKGNGMEINTASGTTNYSFDYVVTSDIDFVLEANDGTTTISESFKARLTPQFPVPAGMLDGINVDPGDPSKVTLVLYAPGKSTVHVIGDFNNWTEDASYLMNKDTARDKFWIELTGLTPQTNHMYQYLVDSSIRVADPYATTILAESNDQFIDATTYPNLPSYPTGSTNHAVTLLRTGDSPYNWEITNFQRPKKTDLVIYELLIRDFDELHSFDAVKARLDYLETLGINAIEFMPLNEFDGNLSWGYNPSFHMALDKYYGTPTAFKQLVDECHKRGMAVIVDVVYNHASGQHPFYRMWNTQNGGYEGQATAENPFFNSTPRHAYNVFNDFNHQSSATQAYVKQTAQYWIEEYNIDGFRWDLTKGFTQNCSEGDGGCTDGIQFDRIEVLKGYADDQWEVDPNFYVIFEHLGGISEEKQWADYRADEGKGIMLWNNLNHDYAPLLDGNSNISNVSYKVKGFDGPSAVSYMESHDEQRVMVDETDIPEATELLKASGAFFFTVPGPKMIWQFGELGYDVSIDFNGRTGEKPIRWDYFDDPYRRSVYESWSKLIKLKTNEPIFETDNFTISLADAGKTIHLTNSNANGDELEHITIIGNFGTSTININPNFQKTGTWYRLLEQNIPVEVSSVSATIELAPGEYHIYGDKPYIDPNDLDSDGVTNNNDLCANTPLGTIVNANGCEFFSLPVDNFSVQTSSETCANSNNGSLSITAIQNLNYSISITGNGVNNQASFTTSHTFNNLQAGDYEVCITVDGQTDYELCFSISITEPEDISVASKVDNSKGTVTLDMNGSVNYNITLNGSTIETSLSTVDLELQAGKNIISVKGDKDCQGEFNEIIYFSENIAAFPNPVNDVLEVYLGTAEGQKTLQLFSVLGRLVYEKLTYDNAIKISTAHLNKGMYILNVSNSMDSSQLKIVKQ